MGDSPDQPLESTAPLPELIGDANVSIDVDNLDCYRAIHGLDRPTDAPRVDPVWTVGLQRAAELLEDYQLEATFFVVGRDLDVSAHRHQTQRLAEEDHEIANHSQDHYYDMRGMSDAELTHQIEEADRKIADATGSAPVGFRTPGYNVNADVIAFSRRAGHRYDASVFPCASYWLAKMAVMRWQTFRGRDSHSSLTNPYNLAAPRQPYFPDALECWRPARRSGHYVEIPVASLGLRMVPVIGTSLHLLDLVGLERIWPIIDRQFPRFFSLEMHAIDFMDARDLDDVPDADELIAHQPDLRIRWHRKAKRYRKIFDAICRDRTPVTLAKATRPVAL